MWRPARSCARGCRCRTRRVCTRARCGCSTPAPASLASCDLPKDGGKGEASSSRSPSALASCAGWRFHGRYAFVGLSKPRYKRFEGPGAGRPPQGRRFRAVVRDPGHRPGDGGPASTGSASTAPVAELYDLAVIPGFACPMAVSPGSPEAGERRQPTCADAGRTGAPGSFDRLASRAGGRRPRSGCAMRPLDQERTMDRGLYERPRHERCAAACSSAPRSRPAPFLGGYRGYVQTRLCPCAGAAGTYTCSGVAERRRRRLKPAPR